MRQFGSIWINLAFFDLFQGKLSFARLGKLFSRGGLVVPPPPKYLPGVLKRGRLRDDLFDLWCRHLLCFFFPRLIEIAKPSFISQRLVSHLAMWCLCRYASMPPQAPCGSGCFTQTQRYASAGPAVQGLASWLLAMDVHHNWYMANNHGLDVYNLYTYIYIYSLTNQF